MNEIDYEILETVDGGGFGDYFAYALGFVWQSFVNVHKTGTEVGGSWTAL